MTTNSKTLRGRPPKPDIVASVNKFLAMKHNDSFFVEGATTKDFVYLRRLVQARGVGISIVRTEHDPVFLRPGVRVWRKEGSYDYED